MFWSFNVRTLEEYLCSGRRKCHTAVVAPTPETQHRGRQIYFLPERRIVRKITAPRVRFAVKSMSASLAPRACNGHLWVLITLRMLFPGHQYATVVCFNPPTLGADETEKESFYNNLQTHHKALQIWSSSYSSTISMPGLKETWSHGAAQFARNARKKLISKGAFLFQNLVSMISP